MLQGVVIYEFEHVIEFGGSEGGGDGEWGEGGAFTLMDEVQI
jgi:hypothetical protein